MKRLASVLVGGLAVLALVVLTVETASAAAPTAYTNYHRSTSLLCNDCHSMHGQVQHDYTGIAGIQTWTNTPKLLKTNAGTVTNMCLTCHQSNGTNYPDVMSTGSGTQVKPRSAGGMYSATKGHLVEQASAQPPASGGLGAAITPFKCTSCHEAHGSPNYRNLQRTLPSAGSLTVTAGIASAIAGQSFSGSGYDVAIYAAGSTTRPAYSTGPGSFYAGANIYYLANGTANKYSTWCGGCHNGFVVGSDGLGKHPTGVALGAASAASSSAQFAAVTPKVPALATAYTAGSVPDTTQPVQVFCQSCHQAHGNNNPFMLLYMTSGGTVSEEGTTLGTSTQGTCQVCHVQGTT